MTKITIFPHSANSWVTNNQLFGFKNQELLLQRREKGHLILKRGIFFINLQFTNSMLIN
jgi:hypothetical protein